MTQILMELRESKFQVRHFLIVLFLSSVFSIGLFILSFIIGWICCMEPAAAESMFSNFTLFAIFTIDLLIILILLLNRYRKVRMKGKLDYCKSYLIVGSLIVLTYLILMPYHILTNT